MYVVIRALFQDFRASVEQLQTLEKETHTLMVSEKVLTDSRDSYEKQKNERKASLLRAEVRISRPVLYFDSLIPPMFSTWRSNWPTHERKLNVPSNT
jgi:hypothetical protein